MPPSCHHGVGASGDSRSVETLKKVAALAWWSWCALLVPVVAVNIFLAMQHDPRPGGTTSCPTHVNPYEDNECVYEEPGPQLGFWMPWDGWPTLTDVEDPRWDGQ